jgi:hypothetical protein
MKVMVAVLGAALVFVGCATEQQSRYAEAARQASFEEYVPSPADLRYFETVEEAEEFVNVAQLKLGSTIGKQYAKGLNAKLSGARLDDDRVVVVHTLTASTTSTRIDLTSDGPLVDKLRKAISVSSVFLVFYGDRAISVSDFYLETGYRYNSNSQYQVFNFRLHEYKADYPIAWGNDQAFNYLKKKPD